LIDYRSAEGRNGRYPRLAAELTGLNVDLIVARGTPATLAAKNARGKIPVVTAPVADPVETGLVASLERPGGNVTGLAMLVSELETKRVDLLRALAPRTKRVAALMNMGNPAFASVWKAIDEAARSMGLQALLVDVRRFAQVAPAVQSAKAQAADALVVLLGPLTVACRRICCCAPTRWFNRHCVCRFPRGWPRLLAGGRTGMLKEGKIYRLTEEGRKAWESQDVAIPAEYRRILWLIETEAHVDVVRGCLREYPDDLLNEWLDELEELDLLQSRQAVVEYDLDFSAANAKARALVE